MEATMGVLPSVRNGKSAAQTEKENKVMYSKLMQMNENLTQSKAIEILLGNKEMGKYVVNGNFYKSLKQENF